MNKFLGVISFISVTCAANMVVAAHPCINENPCLLNQYEIDQAFEKISNAFDQTPVSVKVRERGGVRVEKEDYLLDTEFRPGNFEEVTISDTNDIWSLGNKHTIFQWRPDGLVEHHGVVVTKTITDYSKLLKTNKLKGAITGGSFALALGITAGILLSLTPIGAAALGAGLSIFGAVFGSGAGERAAAKKPEKTSRVYYYDQEV